MIKKLILMCLFFGIFLVKGNATSGGASMVYDDELNDIFATPRYLENGACKYECRTPVDGGHGIQITGIDFAYGVTYCKIFELNNYEDVLRYEAGTTNHSCMLEWATKIPVVSDSPETFQGSKIAYQDDDKLSLSRFLTGIVTLDPSVINRSFTKDTGNVVLSDSVSLRGIITGLYDGSNGSINLPGLGTYHYKDKEALPVTNSEIVSMADTFSKANLAYFSNLFEAVNEVYVHLQNLAFVVIGMFFIGTIGANKLQVYFENRGSSGNREPFLHKFYVPFITFGLFFMPIPEGNGDFQAQASVVQHTIRYFTSNANKIADVASAKGANVYMNKLYSSIGGFSNDGKQVYETQKTRAIFVEKEARKIVEGICRERYPDSYKKGIAWADMTPEEIAEAQKDDKHKAHGTKNDITFQACISAEQQMREAKRQIKMAELFLKGAEAFKADNKTQDILNNIDTFSNSREYELGWFNSSIVPANFILVETLSFMKDAYIQTPEAREAMANTTNTSMRDSANKGAVEISEEFKRFTYDAVGNIIGDYLIYAIMPGYGSIKEGLTNLSNSLHDKFITPLAMAIGKKGSALNRLVVSTLQGGVNFIKPIFIFSATAWVYERILEALPIIVACVGVAVAIVSYLVALCKYYFISPFVTMFAITTKRLDKITEFLVSGVSLFFKPVLIVIFVYLSLFVYSFVKDFFLVISELQFSTLDIKGGDFASAFTIASSTALLKIFAYIASAYIMFRMITTGAEWTMRFIGIDKDNGDSIAQSMTQRLERQSFMGN